MNKNRRVLWSEGLFLRPQHFQSQDCYHDARLREAMLDVHPYAWGLRQAHVDHDALANSVFHVDALSLVFPDGETYQAPETDALPGALSLEALPEKQSRFVVHVALPRLQSQGGNLRCNEAQEPDFSRFSQSRSSVADLYTDATEAEVSFLGKTARLLTEDQPRDEFLSLPLARIQRASTGGFELDRQFIPPSLSIGSSPRLLQQLRQLLDALQAKVDALYGHHREPSKNLIEFRSGDVASFWLLHTANTAFAGLAHLFRNPRLHPERLFEKMLELAGALLTFGPEYRLADLPTYRHDAPEQGFSQLNQMIRKLLESVISQRYFHVDLTEMRSSFHLGQLAADQLDANVEFYLSVSADLPPAELIEAVPLRFKLGAPDDVEACVLSALPGIKLKHLAQVPSAVPVRPGQYYFSLQAQGPLYERMLKSGSVMIYVPESIGELNLELIGVTQ